MFRRILGGTTASVPQNDIDREQWEIFPLHQLDQLEANRFSVGWVLMFNDVLDAERLHEALGRLMTIGDWKKLGGRLKRSVCDLPNCPRRFCSQSLCGSMEFPCLPSVLRIGLLARSLTHLGPRTS
jgi:hypothetical protein